MNIVRDAVCTMDTPVTFGHENTPVYGKGISIRPQYSGKQETAHDQKMYLPELLPLEEYDVIIVLFSGGKDSSGAYYKLRELGVPKSKLYLWHHDIDGGHPCRRMDWPATLPYVKAFAAAEGVELCLSWRVNGFFGEVYRVGASHPIEYLDINGQVQSCRLTSKQEESQRLRLEVLHDIVPDAYYDLLGFEELQQLHQTDPEAYEALRKHGERLMFPAKTGDLSRRWCSAYLKIDVASAVIRHLEDFGEVLKFPAKSSIANGRYCSPNLKRDVADSVIRNMDALQAIGERGVFPAKSSPQQGRWCSGNLKAEVQSSVMANLDLTRKDIKILVVSGERRGESPNRSRYNEMEIHRTNATAKAHRLVHQWRPVIDYTLRDIWEINRRRRLMPHPSYTCGWNRCSCMMCIFSLPSHWAGIRELFPDDYEALCEDEIRLGFTIDNKKSLPEYVGDAESCVYHGDPQAIHQLITGDIKPENIYPTGEWLFPVGAFKGSEGGPC